MRRFAPGGPAFGRRRHQVNIETLESRRLLAAAPLDTAADDARSAVGGCPVCGAGGCVEHLGVDGTVMMACHFDPVAGIQALAAAEQSAVAVAPLADTFKLHSNPSATKVDRVGFPVPGNMRVQEQG